MSKVDFRKNYALLTDERLLDLLSNSAEELKEDALEALLDEIVQRKLTIPPNPDLQSKIQEVRNNFREKSLKLKAYELRYGGMEISEIKSILIKEGLAEEKVAELILRLPNIEFDSKAFVEFIAVKTDIRRQQFVTSSFVFGIGIISLIVFGISESMGIAYFLAGVVAVLFIRYFIHNSDALNTGKYWTDLIRNKPLEIIWLKPIEVKTKLYFVLTIDTENFFELKTTNGNTLNVELLNRKENEIFLDGVMNLYLMFILDMMRGRRSFSRRHLTFLENVENMVFIDL
ncbi:MAG: hypothetical protein IPO32_09615 [Crocinitomicaceae bacterium]|nr:hypothetical protein [Crocinitomicaceae bacterium]